MSSKFRHKWFTLPGLPSSDNREQVLNLCGKAVGPCYLFVDCCWQHVSLTFLKEPAEFVQNHSDIQRRLQPVYIFH